VDPTAASKKRKRKDSELDEVVVVYVEEDGAQKISKPNPEVKNPLAGTHARFQTFHR
jgi:hypothetical protein